MTGEQQETQEDEGNSLPLGLSLPQLTSSITVNLQPHTQSGSPRPPERTRVHGPGPWDGLQ